MMFSDSYSLHHSSVPTGYEPNVHGGVGGSGTGPLFKGKDWEGWSFKMQALLQRGDGALWEVTAADQVDLQRKILTQKLYGKADGLTSFDYKKLGPAGQGMIDNIIKNELSQVDGEGKRWRFEEGGNVLELKRGTAEEINKARFVALTTVERKRTQAYGFLVACMDSSVLHVIRSVERGNPKGVWDRLLGEYARKTAVSARNLRREFHLLQQGGSSVTFFSEEILRLANKIDAMSEEKIGEQDKLTTLLGGLSSEYNPVVTALNLKEDLTWSHACKHLKDFEERLQNEKKNQGQGTLLNLERKRDMNCRTCKAKGRNPNHDYRKCRFRNQDEKRLCFHCKQPGHLKRDCPQRKKHSGTENVVLMNVEKISYNFCVESEKPSEKWLLDSAATCNVTNTRSLLMDVKRCSVKVRAANGEMMCANLSGCVLLRCKVDDEYVKVKLSDVLFLPRASRNIVSVSAIDQKGGKIYFQDGRAWVKDRTGRAIAKAALENGVYALDMKAKISEASVADLEVAKETSRKQRPMDEKSLEVWHKRLGHMPKKAIRILERNGGATGLKPSTDEKLCEPCVSGKAVRSNFQKGAAKAKASLKPWEKWHVDQSGPYPRSVNGNYYNVVFVEDMTGYVISANTKSKADLCNVTKEFLSHVKTQKGVAVKELRSDNEFISSCFDSLRRTTGLKQTFTCPKTPEQNAKAERMIRTLKQGTRANLIQSKLPEEFWDEAWDYTVLVRRVAPKKDLDWRTPQESWSDTPPDMTRFFPFGCYCLIVKPERKKSLEPRTEAALMMRPDDVRSGFRVYSLERKSFLSRRDVRVDINVFPGLEGVVPTDPSASWLKLLKSSEVSGEPADYDSDVEVIAHEPKPRPRRIVLRVDDRKMVLADAQVDDAQDADATDADATEEETEPEMPSADEVDAKVEDDSDGEIAADDFQDEFQEEADEDDLDGSIGEGVTFVEPPRSRTRAGFARTRKPSVRLEEYVVDQDAFALDVFALEGLGDDPTTYKEAIAAYDAKKWIQAMQDEIHNMDRRNVWTLTKLPPGRKAVKSKWVLKRKLNADGTLERHKARIVAKGFTQKKGVDFDETFSAVVAMKTIRTLVAVAATFGLEIDQLDVVAAFLYGDLDETIYMDLPQGHPDQGQGFVCKLNRGIYGLRQASRSWNKKFTAFIARNEELRQLKLEPSAADACLWISRVYRVALAFYVDDVIVMGTRTQVKMMKRAIQGVFETRDLGPLHFILGIRVERMGKHRVSLLQTAFVEKILRRFEMQDCKGIATPMEQRPLSREMSPKSKKDQDVMAKMPYRQAVGSLIYLSQGTRPDVAQAVSVVSRYSDNPGKQHWMAVKRILRYLKGTSMYGLVYDNTGVSDVKLNGYADANWGGDVDTRRSTSGYVLFFGNCCVSWQSKRQATVATSTMEAEYMAAGLATQETLWMRLLLQDLECAQDEATEIFEDNQACIATVKDHGAKQSRMKHVDIKHHFIREVVQAGKVKLTYVESTNNVADMLTKPLSKLMFERNRDKLWIKPTMIDQEE